MNRLRLQPSRQLLLLFGFLVLSTGCSSSGEEVDVDAPESSENVRVWVVEATELDERLLITGRLEAQRATDVSTQESGVVDAIVTDKGQPVAQDEVILRLDRRLLKAQLESAQAMATLRRYNNDRTSTLFDENQVSRQEMLLVHTELEQAEQNAEIARLHYERAAIGAPFAGIVSQRYVELGQLVQAGQRVARVVDPYVLQLEGYATGVSVAYLREGAPARVEVNGSSDILEGRVSWVSVEADPQTGKFAVEVEVPNPDLRVRAGLVARAKVLKRMHESVIAIPRDAVVDGDRGPEVFVVEGNRARARPVVLGPDQGLMVIARSGVREGDRLVVRGQRMLSHDGLVEATEVSKRRDGSMPGDPPSVREEGGVEDSGRGSDSSMAEEAVRR